MHGSRVGLPSVWNLPLANLPHLGCQIRLTKLNDRIRVHVVAWQETTLSTCVHTSGWSASGYTFLYCKKQSKDLYTIQHQHRFVSCTCHSEYGHQRKSFAAGPASGIGVSLGRVLNTESTNQIGFRGMSDSLCASSYNIRTKEWTRRLTLLSSLTILQYQRWWNEQGQVSSCNILIDKRYPAWLGFPFGCLLLLSSSLLITCPVPLDHNPLFITCFIIFLNQSYDYIILYHNISAYVEQCFQDNSSIIFIHQVSNFSVYFFGY